MGPTLPWSVDFLPDSSRRRFRFILLLHWSYCRVTIIFEMTEKGKKDGGSTGSKKPGIVSSKVCHSRPADIMNITNGVQRLQISSKHPEHHSRTSPIIEQPNHRHHLAHVVEHHKVTPAPHQMGKIKEAKSKGKPVGRPKSDAFAQKDLYAGAGFDISPAASSLPIPKFGKATPSTDGGRPATMRPLSVEELLQGGQTLSAPTSSPRLVPPSQQMSEAEQLRIKSERLLMVLSKGPEPNQSPPGFTHREQRAQPPPNTEQLEEMTAQVRRLLNL